HDRRAAPLRLLGQVHAPPRGGLRGARGLDRGRDPYRLSHSLLDDEDLVRGVPERSPRREPIARRARASRPCLRLDRGVRLLHARARAHARAGSSLPWRGAEVRALVSALVAARLAIILIAQIVASGATTAWTIVSPARRPRAGIARMPYEGLSE